ncbi:hypothetical protein MIR68_003812 [Amoeboaphelidium protococcarum]|nr:hypothetical protein MIR68_003812 [Amoeboaphelidium protococcarum]
MTNQSFKFNATVQVIQDSIEQFKCEDIQCLIRKNDRACVLLVLDKSPCQEYECFQLSDKLRGVYWSTQFKKVTLQIVHGLQINIEMTACSSAEQSQIVALFKSISGKTVDLESIPLYCDKGIELSSVHCQDDGNKPIVSTSANDDSLSAVKQAEVQNKRQAAIFGQYSKIQKKQRQKLNVQLTTDGDGPSLQSNPVSDGLNKTAPVPPQTPRPQSAANVIQKDDFIEFNDSPKKSYVASTPIHNVDWIDQVASKVHSIDQSKDSRPLTSVLSSAIKTSSADKFYGQQANSHVASPGILSPLPLLPNNKNRWSHKAFSLSTRPTSGKIYTKPIKRSLSMARSSLQVSKAPLHNPSSYNGLSLKESNIGAYLNSDDLYSGVDLLADRSLLRSYQYEAPSKYSISSQSFMPTTSKNSIQEGFKNLGNSCYMNASLQSLFNLRCFMDKLLKCQVDSSDSHLQFKYPILSELLNLYDQKQVKGHCIDASRLKQCMGRVDAKYGTSEQQDADEFIRSLLGTLESELCRYSKEMGKPMIAGMVENAFEFEIKKTLRCKECESHSVTIDKCRDLSLEIGVNDGQNNDKPLELDSLIQSYFQKQQLEYKCEKCTCKEAEVELQVQKLPQVLIIQLKRFALDLQSMRLIKLQTKVSLSQESVNLQSFCSDIVRNLSHQATQANQRESSLQELPTNFTNDDDDDDDQKENSQRLDNSSQRGVSSEYKLVSAISHLGLTPSFGHYICDCKSQSGDWQCHNDEIVSEVGSIQQLDQKRQNSAYLLFYTLNNDERSDRVLYDA